jgi:hypothetical protein
MVCASAFWVPSRPTALTEGRGGRVHSAPYHRARTRLRAESRWAPRRILGGGVGRFRLRSFDLSSVRVVGRSRYEALRVRHGGPADSVYEALAVRWDESADSGWEASADPCDQEWPGRGLTRSAGAAFPHRVLLEFQHKALARRFGQLVGRCAVLSPRILSARAAIQGLCEKCGRACTERLPPAN